MIFELDQKRVGDWDEFQVRKIGLRMQERKFSRGSTVERELLGEIIEAKNEPEEINYLKLMCQDERLRAKIIKLGS